MLSSGLLNGIGSGSLVFMVESERFREIEREKESQLVKKEEGDERFGF